ncbi:MAG: aminotransferase class I/II-fold pyridoxal phosphate-dependent enzyme [Syntrophomonadaceae bacterium]|nr:aminotransferase class I/II-fold pyridoxal phosphate-dependent enzyme [Syntrophomonadaceae bacterium]
MNTPIYLALCRYRDEKNVLLHMPGHKGGRGFSQSELAAIASLDFTEVPGLDDLHYPQGPLLEAQQLAAKAWGADTSYFLVNGATSGIHSMLMSLGNEADILVPRNVHRSFLGGIILSGARPIFVDCVSDSSLEIAVAVDPDEIRKGMLSCSNLKGVFVESPTYYGTVNDIKGILKFTEPQGIPLMVDEAHGSHFAFHPDYPDSALAEGAQACVHGLHKTIPVLTQGGILHLAASFPWRERVQASYDLLTSTSPSYPLMASIDAGRAVMEEMGEELLERAKEWGEICRRGINGIPGFRCRDAEFSQARGVAGYDPLKVLVEIVGLDTNGAELSYLLRKRYGVQMELAGENYILAMFSPFSSEQDWLALQKALEDLAAQIPGKNRNRISLPPFPPLPRLAITPRNAFLSDSKTVMIKESIGLISTEMVAAYPPGIPCLVPGEVITAEVVEYLEYLKSRNIVVHGLADNNFDKIRVVK